MSFNELPDELVALVASHMKLREVANLLQTQKRIYNVLKRYKLNKPAVDYIRFDFTRDIFGSIRARCRVDLERGKPCVRVRQEELYGTEDEFIASCLEKEYFFQEVEIEFKPDAFVRFCKKFDDVKFYNCKVSLVLLSDEILCQILPNTKFDFSSHYPFGYTQLELSDRTLDANQPQVTKTICAGQGQD